MNKLSNIINKRPVAILLHGNSIKQLENNIEQYKDLDLCYCSMNYFNIQEEKILSKINKKLDFIYCSANYELKIREKDIINYLDRKENNLLITTIQAMWELEYENFMNKYSNKLYYTPNVIFPNQKACNSLTVLMHTLIRAKAYKIILFGCDGLLNKPINDIESISKTYFGKNNLQKERAWNLVEDTINFNLYFSDSIWKKFNIEELNDKLDIVNCSPNTFIKSFKTIGYDKIKEWYNNTNNNTIIDTRDYTREEMNNKFNNLVNTCKTKEEFITKAKEIKNNYYELLGKTTVQNNFGLYANKFCHKLKLAPNSISIFETYGN